MASAAFRLTFVFMVLTLLVGASPAQAQGILTIDTLQIELWPEFDKPSTLVILTGTLAASVSRPAEVTVHIPAATGQPFAVAAQDSTGKLLNTPYNQAASGDTISITLKTDFPTFRVEYYDPELIIRGDARDYTFQWTTDYAVNAVNVRVQEPFDAQGLSTEPALAPSGTGDYGLNYYSASLGQLAAGQQMTLHLKYSKPTATLSANAVSANTPAATPSVSKPSQSLELTPILLAAAGIGLLLIGGGAYSLMRSKKEEKRAARPGRPARRRRERRPPHAATPTSAAPAATPTRFCTQCGRQLLTGDQFCRNCGAKVRDG